MSSWYAKMYRSHEVARERNRREQRRLDSDRHGPAFVARYQLSVLDKEKRMIERELERIRKGIHKPPKYSESERLKENGVTDAGVQANGERTVQETPRKVDTGHSKDENALYDAMLFLQNNPSALVPIVSAHGESDAYLETLEKVSPAFSAEEKQPFVPKYVKNQGLVSKIEKSALLEKYKFLLQRHSPNLRKNSPLLDIGRNSPLLPRRHARGTGSRDFETDSADSGERGRSSPTERKSGYRLVVDESTGHLISPLLSDEEKENLGHGSGSPIGRLPGEQPSGRHTSQTTSSRVRRPLPLHELASGGMDSARDSVQRRLSVKDQGEQLSTDRRPSVVDAEKSADDGAAKATKATTLFPTYDPEYYNADGSLRTQHSMPSFKERWDEAQKARYVRTREQRETDRELTPQEIFGNIKK